MAIDEARHRRHIIVAYKAGHTYQCYGIGTRRPVQGLPINEIRHLTCQ